MFVVIYTYLIEINNIIQKYNDFPHIRYYVGIRYELICLYRTPSQKWECHIRLVCQVIWITFNVFKCNDLIVRNIITAIIPFECA